MPESQVWHDNTGQVCAYGGTLDNQHWIRLPGVATFHFSDNAEEVKAIAEPSVLPELIQDSYQRCVLPLVLQAAGTEALHASAVLTPRGVLALCAESGTGKSTIAYGLSRRGYPLWADDAVAFETGDSRINAMQLPFALHLQPDSARFFDHDGDLTDAVSGGRGAKPCGEIASEPLAILCVLKRAQPEKSLKAVEVVHLSLGVAFPAVLAHAYCFGLHDLVRKRRMIRHYLELTARLPVFEVRFVAGLERLPAILDAIERLLVGHHDIVAR